MLIVSILKTNLIQIHTWIVGDCHEFCFILSMGQKTLKDAHCQLFLSMYVFSVKMELMCVCLRGEAGNRGQSRWLPV